MRIINTDGLANVSHQPGLSQPPTTSPQFARTFERSASTSGPEGAQVRQSPGHFNGTVQILVGGLNPSEKY